MAVTIKTVGNIAKKAVHTPNFTIQPGETILTSFQNFSVNDYTSFGWELASNNNSYVYSDLVITGGLATLQVRNMGNTAFTGRILANALYYPANNIVYL